MTELLSYDEDAREEVASVDVIHGYEPGRSYTVYEVLWQLEAYEEDWPICGDELTKRRMK